jgi:hypothetical protein
MLDFLYIIIIKIILLIIRVIKSKILNLRMAVRHC